MKKPPRKPALADHIRAALVKRPYWGPQSIARAVDATPHVVRVTASKHKIKFMDRYDVEREMDRLVDVVEGLEVGTYEQPVIMEQRRAEGADDSP